MNHLEQLIFEYYSWKGYIVKHNVKVGRRKKGGWEMELDLIAYRPKMDGIKEHLVHLEPSLDSVSWEKRELRFKKKFESARRWIFIEILPWLSPDTHIDQFAILVSHPKRKNEVAGGKIISVDELCGRIVEAVSKEGIIGKKAIPEQFPLLRTIQLVKNGYYGLKSESLPELP